MIEDIIIDNARNGDKDSFISLFNAYEAKVYRTAYFILKDRQYAEDVVQETFIKVYEKIHKLESAAAFEVWLYKITVNTCSSFIKKVNKINTVPIDEGLEARELSDDREVDLPEEILIRKDTRERILESIYSLPIKHRTVLTLFYYNALSIKEISDILKCSEGTVKSRLFYGKKVLRKALAEHRSDIDSKEKGEGLYEL